MSEQKITAPSSSVGADAGQSNKYSDILADFGAEVKPFYDPFDDFDPNFLKTMSMPELYDRVFAVNPPIIDGLLYSGVYLFVGAPKVGKSFLMAQLAYHVSTGTPMWNYDIKPATVLYLALEDDYARLQSRFYRMFGTDSADNLHFSTVANSVNGGLENQLRSFLEAHKDTKLIIIDTLQKVREESKETYSYANDYQIIALLKAFAGAYGICLSEIWFNEKEEMVHVRTHNTDLKKRLDAYSEKFPTACKLLDDDPELGCMEFEIAKARLSFGLTEPNSQERRQRASEYTKKNGLKGIKSVITPGSNC